MQSLSKITAQAITSSLSQDAVEQLQLEAFAKEVYLYTSCGAFSTRAKLLDWIETDTRRMHAEERWSVDVDKCVAQYLREAPCNIHIFPLDPRHPQDKVYLLVDDRYLFASNSIDLVKRNIERYKDHVAWTTQMYDRGVCTVWTYILELVVDKPYGDHIRPSLYHGRSRYTLQEFYEGNNE